MTRFLPTEVTAHELFQAVPMKGVLISGLVATAVAAARRAPLSPPSPTPSPPPPALTQGSSSGQDAGTSSGSARSGSGAPSSGVLGKKMFTVREYNLLFLKKFMYLLSICVPHRGTTEYRSFLTLTVLLVMRILISVAHVKLGAETATHFVSRRWASLYRCIAIFILLSIPGSIVNAALKHFQHKLSNGMDKVLSTYINGLYMRPQTFSYLTQRHYFRPGKKEVRKLDETIVRSIKIFTEKVGAIYCYFIKPVIDCLTYTISLGKVVGWQGPAIIWLFFGIRRHMRNLLKLKLPGANPEIAEIEEGERKVHRHIVRDMDEVSINMSVDRELAMLKQLRERKEVLHGAGANFFSTLSEAFDIILLRYGASVAGYFVLLSPYMINLDLVRYKTSSVMTRDYIICLKSLQELNRAIFEIEDSFALLTGIESSTIQLAEFIEQAKKAVSDGELANQRTQSPTQGPRSPLTTENGQPPSGSPLVKPAAATAATTAETASSDGEPAAAATAREAAATTPPVVSAAGSAGDSGSAFSPVVGQPLPASASAPRPRVIIRNRAPAGGAASPPPAQADAWIADWMQKQASPRVPSLFSSVNSMAPPNLFIKNMNVVVPPVFTGMPSLAGLGSKEKASELGGLVLVKNLSFDVPQSGSLLITGRKGTGKTAIFRVLGGAWKGVPSTVGTGSTSESSFSSALVNPSDSKSQRTLFYVSEEPHLVYGGSLRDQVLYPHTIDDAPHSVTDSDIAQLLALVDHGQVCALCA